MGECIAAVSTANGTGGVAIIRISGAGSAELARRMFEPSQKTEVFEPNKMYPGTICGEGFTDYGFMVCFAAPRSFTGEDSVEFHCHGGVQIARGILKKAISLGARAAERGEFTRRAFMNGKLSLASAEGMIDMINAESLAMLRAGGMLYSEKLTGEVRALQDGLTDILAAISAEIDYPEEDTDGLDLAAIKRDVCALSQKISALAAGYSCGKKIKSGVSVAICGKPNVGKSSLLNAILGYDKAIVSAEAGTTRDAVEGSAEIGGVIFNFYDTAGIRDGAGEIEKIGIERAKNAIRTADIVLFVTEGADTPPKGFCGKLVTVFNKSDVLKPYGKYDAAVSALTGEGVEELKKLLSAIAVGENALDKSFIVEERHYNALLRAKKSLDEAVAAIGSLTCDMIAVDLRETWNALGEITGETASEEVINRIFSKFCVGK